MWVFLKRSLLFMHLLCITFVFWCELNLWYERICVHSDFRRSADVLDPMDWYLYVFWQQNRPYEGTPNKRFAVWWYFLNCKFLSVLISLLLRTDDVVFRSVLYSVCLPIIELTQWRNFWIVILMRVWTKI